MTREEIEKFLDDTKVYVDGKSEEIQKKLFSFGYHWNVASSTEVNYLDSPFLYIRRTKDITQSTGMEFFSNHPNRKITAEEILSLEITGPSYRAFKDQKECWEEMHKHPDFGWIKSKSTSDFYHFDVVSNKVSILDTFRGFCYLNEHFEFTDGTPFGIKVED